MGAKVGGSKELNSEPNVVPLCDILLVLLIIFMVVTPMIQQGVNVTLPEAVNTVSQSDEETRLTVYIQKDGSVMFDEKIVPDITKLPILLEEKIEEQKIQDLKVALKADINLPYGRIQTVMTEIKNAGVEVIGLLVERAAGSN